MEHWKDPVPASPHGNMGVWGMEQVSTPPQGKSGKIQRVVGQAKRRTPLRGTESAAHPTVVDGVKTTSHTGEAEDEHSHTFDDSS